MIGKCMLGVVVLAMSLSAQVKSKLPARHSPRPGSLNAKIK
jgi:hypothetical protein